MGWSPLHLLRSNHCGTEAVDHPINYATLFLDTSNLYCRIGRYLRPIDSSRASANVALNGHSL